MCGVIPTLDYEPTENIICCALGTHGSQMSKLTDILALTTSSIWICKSSISISMLFRAFTAAAQVNSDSSSCEKQEEGKVTGEQVRDKHWQAKIKDLSWTCRGMRLYQNCADQCSEKCVFSCKWIIWQFQSIICWDSKVFSREAYLIFQLGNLPLAGGVTFQVVEHNLCISQKDFGPLQVFLQPLLCLHIPLAHLNDKTDFF